MQVTLRYKKKLLIYIKESIQNIEKFAFFFYLQTLIQNIERTFFFSKSLQFKEFLFLVLTTEINVFSFRLQTCNVST